MSEFKTGDVVVLKSGGPPMTVASADSAYCECVWFPQGFPTEPAHSNFPVETLKLYADPA